MVIIFKKLKIHAFVSCVCISVCMCAYIRGKLVGVSFPTIWILGNQFRLSGWRERTFFFLKPSHWPICSDSSIFSSCRKDVQPTALPLCLKCDYFHTFLWLNKTVILIIAIVVLILKVRGRSLVIEMEKPRTHEENPCYGGILKCIFNDKHLLQSCYLLDLDQEQTSVCQLISLF